MSLKEPEVLSACLIRCVNGARGYVTEKILMEFPLRPNRKVLIHQNICKHGFLMESFSNTGTSGWLGQHSLLRKFGAERVRIPQNNRGSHVKSTGMTLVSA